MKSVLILFATLLSVGCSCETIPEGHKAFISVYGEVKDQKGPGLYVEGVTEQVILFSTRLETVQVKADAASKDLQRIRTEVTIPYTIDTEQALKFFQTIGNHEMFATKVLGPSAQEAVKAATAGYTAEELVTKRIEVKQFITNNLTSTVNDAVKSKGVENAIMLGNISITDFQFSEEFNRSIEQKMTSEQEALKAKKDKEKRITDAEAANSEEKLKADAIAYSIEQQSKAKSDAIKREAEALRSNPDLLKLRTIEKWSGKLPVVASGATPFITLKDLQ